MNSCRKWIVCEYANDEHCAILLIWEINWFLTFVHFHLWLTNLNAFDRINHYSGCRCAMCRTKTIVSLIISEFYFVLRRRNRPRHLSDFIWILIYRPQFVNNNNSEKTAHALNRKTKALPFIQMVDIIGDNWAPATFYVPNRLKFQVYGGTAWILTRWRNLQHVLFFPSFFSCSFVSSFDFCVRYFVIFICLAFFVLFLNLCCCELNSLTFAKYV